MRDILESEYKNVPVLNLPVPSDLTKYSLKNAQWNLKYKGLKCKLKDCYCKTIWELRVSERGIGTALKITRKKNWSHVSIDHRLEDDAWYYGQYHCGIIYSDGA